MSSPNEICTRCHKSIHSDHYCVDGQGKAVCCECYGHRHLTAQERLDRVADELAAIDMAKGE